MTLSKENELTVHFKDGRIIKINDLKELYNAVFDIFPVKDEAKNPIEF